MFLLPQNFARVVRQRHVNRNIQMDVIRIIMGRKVHARAHLRDQEGFLKKVTSKARPKRERGVSQRSEVGRRMSVSG